MLTHERRALTQNRDVMCGCGGDALPLRPQTHAASAGSKLSPAWFSIVREGGAGNAGRMRDGPPVLRHRISFACEQWPGDLSSVEPPLYTGFPACVS